jgi:hypothetical protein
MFGVPMVFLIGSPERRQRIKPGPGEAGLGIGVAALWM